MSLRVFGGASDLGAAAAADVAAALARAIATGREAALLVPGGTSPLALYQRLASGIGLAAVDWARVHVWFADERAVPPDDPESNYRLVLRALAEPAGLARDHLHRMPADAPDLDAGCAAYARELPEVPDVVVLGVGEDGHIASLFPGSPLLEERLRRVAAVLDSPKPPPRRMTVTPAVLGRALRVVVLASGTGKARAVAMAHAPDGDPHATPARLVAAADWYVDHAAAALLPS